MTLNTDLAQRVAEELNRINDCPSGGIEPSPISLEELVRLRRDVNNLINSTSIRAQDVVQFPITDTTVRINIPDERYSPHEPIVVCTVLGGVTHVSIQPVPEYVLGIGEVYTHILFTFPPSLIGLRCNAWLTGG